MTEKIYLNDNAQLMSEWNWEKNNDIIPSKITLGSNKKVWWRCNQGHEWQASITKRAKGNGCPICRGKKILPGYNDLATTHPELVKEWDKNKNIGLSPTEVGKGSEKKVWWLCKCGHSWSAAIYSRATGVGCPRCAKERQSSYPEKALYYYINKMFPDAISGYKSAELNSFELDIYIPNVQVAIEYDGDRWHQDLKRDFDKDDICKKMGIKLIRVREPKCPVMSDSYSTVIKMSNKKKNFDTIIYQVLDEIQSITNTPYNFIVDLNNDNVEILELLNIAKKDNSIAIQHPDLLKEWDYEKNGEISPYTISVGSDKKVWWLCDQGHSYISSVSARVRGRGCPVCGGKIVVKGFNDFPTHYPHLLNEWDYDKNTISPFEVAYGSDQKFWWKCKLGHSYEQSVNNRRIRQSCPICSNKKILIGFNDLCTTHPKIVEEWDNELNLIQSSSVTAGSHKKVWWKCRICGYKWLAPVYSRTSGHGCPECAKNNRKKV